MMDPGVNKAVSGVVLGYEEHRSAWIRGQVAEWASHGGLHEIADELERCISMPDEQPNAKVAAREKFFQRVATIWTAATILYDSGKTQGFMP